MLIIPFPALESGTSWAMRGCSLVKAKLWLNVVFTVVYGWRQTTKNKKQVSMIKIGPLASTKEHQQLQGFRSITFTSG